MQLKAIPKLLCVTSILVAMANGASVTVDIESNIVKITNQIVSLKYNLKDGTYSISDVQDPDSCLENAHCQVNDLDCRNAIKHSWKQHNLTDVLGIDRPTYYAGVFGFK